MSSIDELPEGKSKRNRDRKAEISTTTPILDNFSRDLTLLAVAGELDPVIGRKKEIKC